MNAPVHACPGARCAMCAWFDGVRTGLRPAAPVIAVPPRPEPHVGRDVRRMCDCAWCAAQLRNKVARWQ